MPRIRTIKPELPDDETLGACSRDARLMFVLLWTRCDDHGLFRASPALLRGQLFPYDEDLSTSDVAGLLAELSDAGRVTLYEIDGQSYGAVVNWGKHQRVDNAGKPLHPPPPGGLGGSPQSAENLGGSPLDHDHDHDLDHDHDHAAARRAPQPVDNSAWWSEVWNTYADRALRCAQGVKSPDAWKRKVRRDAPKEQGDRARQLVEQFDLDARQLGCVLAGEESILRHAPRRIAS